MVDEEERAMDFHSDIFQPEGKLEGCRGDRPIINKNT